MQNCKVLLEAMFDLGESRHLECVLTKMPLALPHQCPFTFVHFEEALPDTEHREALSLTGWSVIPWTLSAMLRCVKKLVLCESWAPENGERGIGKP